MKKQSNEAKMDESLGERKGKESSKKQSMESRRHESEGARHKKESYPSHEEDVKGGEHSPMHHHKMIKHHLAELHKMAKNGAKHKK
ncbi:MAG: hypothetical protein KGI50_05450 [Patescibacteria group bacterium]|nr:hypothetical protein [Patescibacteria group bacterium]MDE2438749.1 hypothetical protein [Patescibacteria group bacterium]